MTASVFRLLLVLLLLSVDASTIGKRDSEFEDLFTFKKRKLNSENSLSSSLVSAPSSSSDSISPLTSTEATSTDMEDELVIELLSDSVGLPIVDLEKQARRLNFLNNALLSNKGSELLFSCNESVVHGYDFDWGLNGKTLDSLSVRFRVLFFKILIDRNQAVEQILLLLVHDVVDLTFPILDTQGLCHETFLTLMCGRFVSGNMEKLKFFIRYCPKDLLDQPNSSFQTPLRLAVAASNLQLVRKLANAGANMNDFSNGKMSPFLMSMTLPDKSIYEFFLSTGKFDLNGWVFIDGECVNFISLASKHVSLDFLFNLLMTPGQVILLHKNMASFMVHLFLHNQWSFLRVIEFFTKRFLMPFMLNAVAELAVEKNCPNILTILIQAGHDLSFDCVDENGLKCKLLHLAIKKRNLETVKVLLDLGADIEAPNGQNFPPLLLAVQAQNSAIVFELVRRGARAGMISLVKAIFRADHPLTLKLLLKESVFPLQIQDYGNGHNIFTLTVAANRPKLLKVLFKITGISTFTLDSQGRNIFTHPLPGNDTTELASLLKEYSIIYNFCERAKK